MTTSLQTHSRLDDLDAVRAFALLLGIVFHAGLSFMPVYIGWAVMDVSTSQWVTFFVLLSHSFRMELFFLVAGFFSHMTFHRKGHRYFLRSRLQRILIPFVIGWFILYPLLIASWVMGMQSLQGEVSIWPALQQGWAALISFSTPFAGTHLWFLYYLLLITACVLGLRLLLTPVKRRVNGIADAAMQWLTRSRWATLALAVPTAACLWFMSQWGMDTPDKSLWPQWPVLLVYGGFFSFGWLLHRQAPLMGDFGRVSPGKLVVCLLAVAAVMALSGYEIQRGHPDYTLLKLAFQFSYAVMMWQLVALTIGLFNRLVQKPNAVVRYLADASYWLYLVHLPVVIWLQIALAEMPWHWTVKLPLIVAITLAVSLLLYDLLVRPTLIGAQLNGSRKPSVLLNRQPGQAGSRA